MPSLIKTPMADLRKKAAVSLAKHGIDADGEGGIKVRLILDHSYSMQPWYSNGAVQKLTEQVLALASKLDDDGTIEVWYFGDSASEVQTLSLTRSDVTPDPASPRRGLFGRRGAPESTVDPYYEGWVNRTHSRVPWGSTNYVAAIRAVSDYRKAEKEAEPTLVVFQTDGGPNDRVLASRALKDVSGEDIFFAFVVFGNEESDAADYVRNDLDNLTGRVRDNASSIIVPDFRTVSDETVYDGVLGEFRSQWLPDVLG